MLRREAHLVALPGLEAVALGRAPAGHALGYARVGSLGVRRGLQNLCAPGHDAVPCAPLDHMSQM
eukprot:1235912-Pyramimonas_sp.AAC.1